MPRIRDIRLIPLAYRMPEVRAYGMARALVSERGSTLVEVETEDGVVGIGVRHPALQQALRRPARPPAAGPRPPQRLSRLRTSGRP